MVLHISIRIPRKACSMCAGNKYECMCVTLGAHYLHVEVSEAAGCGQGQFDHALHSDSVSVQVVKQGAVFMVV